MTLERVRPRPPRCEQCHRLAEFTLAGMHLCRRCALDAVEIMAAEAHT